MPSLATARAAIVAALAEADAALGVVGADSVSATNATLASARATVAAALTEADAALGAMTMLRPTIHTGAALDLNSLVLPDFVLSGVQTYDRFLNRVEVKTPTTLVRVIHLNVNAGATKPALTYSRYGLLVAPLNPDGTLGPAVDRASGFKLISGTNWSFNVTLTWGPEDGCPAFVQVVAYDASGNVVAAPTESYPGFFVKLNRNGQLAAFPLYVAQRASFDWLHPADVSYNADRVVPPVVQWAAIPKSLLATPTAFPRPPRIATIPATVTVIDPLAATASSQVSTAAAELERINLLQCADNDSFNQYIPRLTKSGDWDTGGVQDYFFSDMAGQEFPPYDEVDGPPGIAQLHFPLMTMISDRPESPPVARKLYVSTKLAWCKVMADGTRTTLFGLRNKGNQRRYGNVGAQQSALGAAYDEPRTINDYDVVGTWDASIPVAERYAKESWGAAFNPATLGLDPNAAPISDPPGSPFEPPHLVGPQLAVTDGHGYLLLAQFLKNQHGPVTLRRLCAMNDPWGMKVWTRTGNLIVAERGAHRIVEKDWNGNTVRVVLEDATASRFGAVNPATRTFEFSPALFTIANNPSNAAAAAKTVRAATRICSPEGVFIDGDWCYFGSYAMGAVCRINLLDGSWNLAWLPTMDWLRQSHFIVPAISDGTFFPRGTGFSMTFAQVNNGLPEMFLACPGTAATGEALSHAKATPQWAYGTAGSVKFDMPEGANGNFGAIYGTALDVKHGMLACASSGPGITIYLRKQPNVPGVDYVKMKAGRRYWRQMGYDLVWGQNPREPVHALPLPWGEDANLDYWLTALGAPR